MEDSPLPWFCPPERAILEREALHIPRSLAKARRNTQLEFTIDRDFKGVIAACSEVPRPGQNGTWITSDIEKAYLKFHELGHAHSVEAWKDGQLVGGLYGVDAGGSFAGESMFHTEPNASKLALLHLLDHLHSRGLDWMDIQMLTPHLEVLGAREIPRDEFLDRLDQTLKLQLKLF